MPRKQRHRLQCKQCGEPFWTEYPDQETCNRKCGAKRRIAVNGLGGLRPGNHREYEIKLPPSKEPKLSVEHQLERAKAARLARERATGQRTFTISDGWDGRGNGDHNAGGGWGWND